jgi:hypothetical protein
MSYNDDTTYGDEYPYNTEHSEKWILDQMIIAKHQGYNPYYKYIEDELYQNCGIQEFICHKFNNDTILDTSFIVKTYIECYGNIIILPDQTEFYGKPQTIVDYLENAEEYDFRRDDVRNDTINTNFRVFSLHKMFLKHNVQKADKYSELELYIQFMKAVEFYDLATNVEIIFPIHTKVIKIQKWYKRNKLYRKLFLVAEVMFQEQMHPNNQYMQNYIKTLDM